MLAWWVFFHNDVVLRPKMGFEVCCDWSRIATFWRAMFAEPLQLLISYDRLMKFCIPFTRFGSFQWKSMGPRSGYGAFGLRLGCSKIRKGGRNYRHVQKSAGSEMSDLANPLLAPFLRPWSTATREVDPWNSVTYVCILACNSYVCILRACNYQLGLTYYGKRGRGTPHYTLLGLPVPKLHL